MYLEVSDRFRKALLKRRENNQKRSLALADAVWKETSAKPNPDFTPKILKTVFDSRMLTELKTFEMCRCNSRTPPNGARGRQKP